MCPPCLIEIIKVDISSPVLVEEAKDDFVLGIGLREEVLEDRPVCETDLALVVAIGYGEEDAILESLDFVLGKRVS